MTGKVKPRTKRQHYVPRFYLARFSRNGKNLFVFDKFKGSVFQGKFMDIAQENGFYDLPPNVKHPDDPDIPSDPQLLEKALAVCEGKYFLPDLELLLKQAEKGQIDNDLIERFSMHVALQWMRTRQYREIMKELTYKATESLVTDLMKLNFRDTPPELYPKVVYDEASLDHEHCRHFFNEENWVRLANRFDDLMWIVGINDTDNPLYTSDQPVVRCAHLTDGVRPLLGVTDPGVEFAFPLSSRFVLRMLEKRHFGSLGYGRYDGRTMPLTVTDVEHLNTLQVLRSYRQVYCERNDFELARRVAKEHPEVCTPERRRVEVVTTPFKDLDTLSKEKKNYLFTYALE